MGNLRDVLVDSDNDDSLRISSVPGALGPQPQQASYSYQQREQAYAKGNIGSVFATNFTSTS